MAGILERLLTLHVELNNNNNNNNSCIYNAHISIQRGCSRRNILLLPRSLDTISRPHLQCTISTPKGAFLAELPIRQIHTQEEESILTLEF